METKSFSEAYLEEVGEIAKSFDTVKIDKAISILANTRKNKGRLFLIGVGGSAGNCSHAVNDFRKICNINAYTFENLSELTARTNDSGWASIYVPWLKTSNLNSKDAIMVLSVGGGDKTKNISPNIVEAIDYAKEIGCKVIGIVGKAEGYTAKNADICLIVPTVNINHITPHSEAFQAILWHLMVSHPFLKQTETKWESTTKVK